MLKMGQTRFAGARGFLRLYEEFSEIRVADKSRNSTKKRLLNKNIGLFMREILFWIVLTSRIARFFHCTQLTECSKKIAA